MKISLIGVGLIGGSFSLALRDQSGLKFGGYDANPMALKEADKLGIIDILFESMELAVAWADVVILSIPVNAIRTLVPKVLDQLNDHQLVVDFGSTKSSICEAVGSHEKRQQFLAAHPIAGTEYSGPSAAFKELFEDKNLILCETEKTREDLLQRFELLASQAGFYCSKMDADEHDRHLAYISHLSHVTSYVLSNTVLGKERDGEVILELAGSGFDSTVRLAKSSPSMWSSIFMENKEMVLKGIEAYKKELEILESFIKEDKNEQVMQYLEEGRTIRKILK